MVCLGRRGISQERKESWLRLCKFTLPGPVSSTTKPFAAEQGALPASHLLDLEADLLFKSYQVPGVDHVFPAGFQLHGMDGAVAGNDQRAGAADSAA